MSNNIKISPQILTIQSSYSRIQKIKMIGGTILLTASIVFTILGALVLSGHARALSSLSQNHLSGVALNTLAKCIIGGGVAGTTLPILYRYADLGRSLVRRNSQIAMQNITEEDRNGVCSRLLRQNLLSDITTKNFYQHLKNTYPHIQVVEQLQKLPEIEADKTLVLIPIVLKKQYRFLPDHFVLLAFDVNHKQLIYIDSKGECGRRSQRLVNDCNFTIGNLIEEAAKHYKATSVWENTIQNQMDPYNCGVYGCHAMEQLALGKSPNEIVTQGLSFNQATAYRIKMATNILACQKNSI